MKNISLLLFLLAGYALSAQSFRIEFGYSRLSYEQTGNLFSQDPLHVPAWYSTSSVNRKFASNGFTATVFYPLNFGTRSFEKFTFGPQVGFALNQSSLDQSSDKNYSSMDSRMIFRLPVLFSARVGTLHTVYRHVVGVGVASGIEMMKLNIADQTGTFFLPVIQVNFAVNRLQFNINSYPLPVESIYVIDGNESPRLTTSFIEFQFLIAFDCYPKRYNNDAPKKSLKKSGK